MSAHAPIPMVDLREQYLTLKDSIDQSIADVLEKTHFIMGENVVAFEKEAADYLGVAHAIGCANGTDALHLAMLARGLGPGDEIITTPFTFIATAEAIAYVGATPVFVDIDPVTYNLDAAAIAAAITPKTRAIVPVHLFGMPSDMKPIMALADEHELAIIEDCAQSFGALVDGRQTGSIGNIGCFSFFPSKNLGAFGDGGMVATNDDELASSLRVLRTHGSAVRYHHSVIGYNSRLDEMQAAILRQKLPHIDRFNRERLRVATRYNEHFADLPLQLPPLAAPDGHSEVTPVFHQYTLLSEKRDAAMAALKEEQIASAIYYPIPLHRQEAIEAHLTRNMSCPVAEDYSKRCFSLPVYPELPDATIDRIAGVVRGVVG